MKTFLSIILSFFLLLSSTGITYAQHYCGGHKMMEKVTFGEEHLTCGMVLQTSDCDETITMMDCCDNEYASVTTDDHYAKAHFDIQLSQDFLIAFTTTFIIQEPLFEKATVVETLESPLLRQYRPLYQVFESYLI